MSVLVSGNVITSWLQSYLARSTWDVEKIEKRLLTGEREGDSVRRGIGTGLLNQALTSSVQISNLNDGISYLNIADAAIEAGQELMMDVKDLINQALASTDPTERASYNNSANALIEQANDIISNASFSEKSIFFGENTQLLLQAGEGRAGAFQVSVGDGTSLLYGTVDLTMAGDPTAELSNLETFLETVENRRNTINAGRARASAAMSYLGVMVGLYEDAGIEMATIDEAEEVVALEEALARQAMISDLLIEQLARKEQLVGQLYDSIRSWTA